MLLSIVFDDELINADTFITDGRGSCAVPDVFEECAVQTYAFLVTSDDVGAGARA
jgi:hypothetical protein